MVAGRKARAKRRSDPVDAAILDAAEHVFGWKGYQQTTMETLAHETGLSVGTLYNTFAGKEDIYSQVAQRIGEAVVSRIRPLVEVKDPEEAVLDVIRLRLHNYVNDRLFFQPFSFPAYLGIQPEPARLCDRVKGLHREYVDLVEKIFGRCLARTGHAPPSGLKMAVWLEGMITAFMGYWSSPLQSDNLAQVARHMKTVLLRGIARLVDPPADAATAVKETRAIYISRYDLERLNELLEVVRVFGKKECRECADALAEELKYARVTNPREVPPDVVTMNSKVRVVNVNTGTDRVCSLVFPRDAALAADNVSVLNGFGTAILGRRVGDVFALGSGQDAVMYRATQMLYQPEAAGDYHL